jgi:hypothetical protein
MKRIIYFLITFAAISQGVMWVNLFSLFHHSALMYIGGIPAGLSIVGLIVYSANALPRVQSQRARRGGWLMLTLVMIAEPVVLGIVNWWFMPADFKTLFASFIVAGGASLIISLVLVMGALVDRSLVPAPKQEPKQRKQKKAKLEAEPLAPPAFQCATCGYIAKSQKALNGHHRKHKRIVGYVASFEPVTEQKVTGS